MPYIKFDNPKSFASNKESSSAFIHYLSKEDFTIENLSKEFFFNQSSKLIPDFEVIESIDKNRKGLGKNDAKFYTGSVNLSAEELLFLNNDLNKIKEYTVKVMELYAAQFNKSLNIDNLNWYAKIEKNRYYKGDDKEVENGTAKQGDIKPGIHAHFIIGHKSKDNNTKISPKTNHRNTTKGPIVGGFDRDSFKEICELKFDEMFKYLRPIEQTYRYNKIKANGSLDKQVQIISGMADDRIDRRGYHLLTHTEKEGKIEKLANFICFGGSKSSVKMIDVELLVKIEKENSYSGHIYRSLLSLNRNMKDGKTPQEYNLTELIINHAQFLLKSDTHTPKQTQSSVIAMNQKFAEEYQSSWSNIPLIIPNVGLGNSHSETQDDIAEAMRRKKKKRRIIKR